MDNKYRYISTRNNQEPIDFYHSILQGIAKDGGLLVPDFDFEKVDLEELKDLNYEDLAKEVLSHYIDEEGYDLIHTACHEAYGKDLFTKNVAPLEKAGNIHVLELYQGPTAAFKDMALTILPHFMTLSLKKLNVNQEVCILAATSGDTGKAALEGFKDVENTQIKVFYPSDGVSNIQKQQMITQEGKNVEVIGIHGNFDDAQTAVKKAFNDENLKQLCKENNIFLSSANSINIGRLLPQVVYYFYAYFQLVNNKEIELGDEVNFCIPSGNFGNCLAGYFAKNMGLPIHKFILASNENNILTDFFNTGVYDANRKFYKTIAPAMDILVSSNLERLVWFLSNKDGNLVKKYYEQLASTGVYKVDEEIFNKAKETFYANYANEQEVLDSIASMYNENHYLIDTHTATGYHVIKEYLKTSEDKRKIVLLSTASAYKFPENVLKSLTGKELNEYDAIDALCEYTHIEVPKPLQGMKDKEVLHKTVIDKEDIIEYIAKKLGGSYEG